MIYHLHKTESLLVVRLCPPLQAMYPIVTAPEPQHHLTTPGMENLTLGSQTYLRYLICCSKLLFLVPVPLRLLVPNPNHLHDRPTYWHRNSGMGAAASMTLYRYMLTGISMICSFQPGPLALNLQVLVYPMAFHDWPLIRALIVTSIPVMKQLIPVSGHCRIPKATKWSVLFPSVQVQLILKDNLSKNRLFDIGIST